MCLLAINNVFLPGDHAVKELERLKLYLADLPTREEHGELKSKLAQAETELEAGREHIDNLVDERTNMQRYSLCLVSKCTQFNIIT